MFSHVNFVIGLRTSHSKILISGRRYLAMSSLTQATNKRMQPSWTQPDGDFITGLKLYNSLTRKKESFIPSKGRKVNWYTCGPTVYDDSHMGHARSYMCFDIMRRVMKDYFKYDIYYVMNITDVDDKIIKRTRQNHLYQVYIEKEKAVDEITKDAQSSLELLSKKMLLETDEDKRNTIARDLNKAQNALTDKTTLSKEVLLEQLRDVLSIWLDHNQGSSVIDNELFLELPRHFEERFHDDMKALNVLSPNALTRVSEYIPEIIEFIEKIIANGYGYVSNGSVYFDTAKFDESPNHSYAKLVPEAFGDTSALEEGEGELGASISDRLKDKKSKTDFALWKISKEGEPSWDSPWGKGRPGWHIECSAMAGKLLGDSMDIHTGGVDLKFPHHDNELAQSEAYFENNDWVKYFLHSGHLTISGCKMSKSLKNFVSIKNALKEHSARQLRMFFLLHGWNDTLDYSQATMERAVSYDKKLNDFFGTIKDLLWKQKNDMEAFRKNDAEEFHLTEKFFTCKKQVHEHLCDNLETRDALERISRLISETYKYIELKRSSSQLPNKMLVEDISAYINDMFKMFGCGDFVGAPSSSEQSGIEEEKLELVRLLSKFRDDVKAEACKKKDGDILKLCDQLRDDELPFHGVKLEDTDGEGAVVKLVEREVLLKEREARFEQIRQKELKRQEQLAKERAKLEAGKMSPSDLFKSETSLYSAFDERGVPTHDASGEPLSKSKLKNLEKQYQGQVKLHEQYLKFVEKNQENGI